MPRSSSSSSRTTDEPGDEPRRAGPGGGGRAQARIPDFRVEQFGGASAKIALDDTVGEDFQRAEYTALPITLGILIVVFGALVAAGIPLLLGLTGRGRDRAARRSRASSSRWTRPRTR